MTTEDDWIELILSDLGYQMYAPKTPRIAAAYAYAKSRDRARVRDPPEPVEDFGAILHRLNTDDAALARHNTMRKEVNRAIAARSK